MTAYVPTLSGPVRVLAELAEALHADARRLGEHELRHLEQFVGMRSINRVLAPAAAV